MLRRTFGQIIGSAAALAATPAMGNFLPVKSNRILSLNVDWGRIEPMEFKKLFDKNTYYMGIYFPFEVTMDVIYHKEPDYTYSFTAFNLFSQSIVDQYRMITSHPNWIDPFGYTYEWIEQTKKYTKEDIAAIFEQYQFPKTHEEVLKPILLGDNKIRLSSVQYTNDLDKRGVEEIFLKFKPCGV